MTRHGILNFDGVYVIESLRSGARLTGKALHEGTIGPLAARLDNFSSEYRRAHNGLAFLLALEHLRDRYARQGRSPILHIEAHGHEDGRGLLLASGELLSWEEIRDHLEEINQITEFNLLVVMAACKGAHLIRSMHPTRRAPFWAVIGPPVDVFDVPLQEALERFYGALLTTQSGTDAMKALNDASDASGIYKLLDAEGYFCWIFEKYESDSSEAALTERVNRLVADWARGHVPDVKYTQMIRAEAWDRIRDHPRWYDHLRHRFLMLDLYPDNADRFGLSYEMCRAKHLSPNVDP